MKELRVDFHISWKRTLFLIASFSLVSAILCFFVAISVKSNLMQLNSLLHSDYLFSATVEETKEPDVYFQYSAGIGFSITADSKTGINADVIMQTAESGYTDLIFWNAGKMAGNEVAISKGIAKAYGLKVGDCIYSKHIVDGIVHEYSVNQVLPDVASVRTQGFTDGIIIMGYDPSYIDNVMHSTLLFTNEDINVLLKKNSGTLANIVYREDEIKKVCREMMPYYGFLVVLSIIITIGICIILKKSIVYNFKRLVILGFDQGGLNKSLCSLVFGTGIVSIMVSFVLSMAVLGIIGFNVVTVMLLIFVVIVECITLLIGGAFIKGQLWRQ